MIAGKKKTAKKGAASSSGGFLKSGGGGGGAPIDYRIIANQTSEIRLLKSSNGGMASITPRRA